MKRKRRRDPVPTPNPNVTSTGRVHGDSYADVSVREPDYVGTASTHGPDIDRRAEEPSDAPLDEAERLEGN